MALADILSALRRDGDQEVARIAAERDATVAAIVTAGREHAQQEEAAAVTARDAVLAQEADVIRHRAALHVERRLQEAREAVFQEILDRAKDRLLHHRRDPSYPATVAALVEECLAFLGDAKTVRADPRDADLVEEVLTRFGHPQVDPTLECWGGVVADDGNGVIVRNTLEARLAHAETELRLRIGNLVPGLRAKTEGAVP